MGNRDDKPMMTDEEFMGALADATARGLIEWHGDEDVRLTDKGVDHAISLRERLGDTDYLILSLLFERMKECIKS